MRSGERVGITERAAHRIVVELADAGYITRERNGRRNRYTINTHLPLPDPIAREQNVGELLEILTTTRGSKPAGRSHGTERVIAGLLLAVGCALAGSVAVLLKQRGAVAAPTVVARHPVRSAIDLFRSKWWTIGWLVALGAWLLHVGALSLASLSSVQAVISGGLVFLAILAERFFGFHLGHRQWIGLVVTAIGLAVLGLDRGARRPRSRLGGRADRRRGRGDRVQRGADRGVDPPRAAASAQRDLPRHGRGRPVRGF